MDSRQDFTDRQTMAAGDFEYFHYRDDPHLEVQYHNHDFYEVYFFISGKVTYTIEGKSYRLRPGDLVLVNNRELHRPEVEPGQTYERIVLWIRPYFLEYSSCPETNLTTCFEGEGTLRHHLLRLDEEVLAGIRGALTRLGKACTSSGYGSRLLQESILKELLVLINRASLDTESHTAIEDMKYNEKVSCIIDYINENLAGDLSLDALSRQFYTSRYHLLREFKKHAGCTLHHFIQRKRLIAAKELLRRGGSVSDACNACGFGDYSNFIRAFRQNFGAPPGRYARNMNT